jgi:DNA-binding response OmpR family regulator
MATILWIENKGSGNSTFIPGLRKVGYAVEVVSTGTQAMVKLPDVDPDIVVVNASSMRSNGKRICKTIHDERTNLPILIIADGGKKYGDDVSADLIMYLPFTIRKLKNRLIRILPGEGNQVYHVGPIRLDLERKKVQCHNKESKLTPRLIMLLKMLMEHPGEVLERKRLFREIWETDYVADTRTLDVHISWLRQAIEQDPRNPAYLKTIRGVGYRLDV